MSDTPALDALLANVQSDFAIPFGVCLGEDDVLDPGTAAMLRLSGYACSLAAIVRVLREKAGRLVAAVRVDGITSTREVFGALDALDLALSRAEAIARGEES